MSKLFYSSFESIAAQYAVLVVIFCLIMYAALTTLLHGEICGPT